MAEKQTNVLGTELELCGLVLSQVFTGMVAATQAQMMWVPTPYVRSLMRPSLSSQRGWEMI